jgi:uncharacterized membrane protein
LLSDAELQEKLTDLERRLRSVEAALVPMPPRRVARQPLSTPPPSPRDPLPAHVIAVPRGPDRSLPRTVRRAAPARRPVSDLIGGRVLAWVGGVATFLGIALFLALAISRGWIGVEVRVLLAGAASLALMAAGLWLHANRGRTEASVALVAVATAGMFATLVVASHVYALVPPLVAVAASIAVAGFAALLSVRWAASAIGAIGIGGALASPLLMGAPRDGLTIAILAVTAGCAGVMVVRQRWSWLAIAMVLLSAAQWGPWIIAGQPAGAALAVLVWFGLIGMAAALLTPGRSSDERLQATPAIAFALSGLLVAVLGAVALRDEAGGNGAALWLAGFALAHIAAGTLRWRRLAISEAHRRLAIVIGMILGDVAFGLSAGGVVLVAGWALAAVGFAAYTRRAATSTNDRFLLEAGVGAHIALALVRALFETPPASLASASPELLPLMAIAALAASCLVSADLLGTQSRKLQIALRGLGLAAVAYLTAGALNGPTLVAAWAAESAALGVLAARHPDPEARYGALAFAALALGHTIAIEAPPRAFITGADSLGAAAIALGSIAIATVSVATRCSKLRPRLLAAGAATLLYLGSVAIITAFQPGSANADDTLLDLSVRQQGQVLLSGCWGLIGVTALVIGLRRQSTHIRNAALAVLLLTAAKVFLYDLSTLTSIYRVMSFIAVGLLLLAGAFAYQRLRPPPAPDIRRVHRSQR